MPSQNLLQSERRQNDDRHQPAKMRLTIMAVERIRLTTTISVNEFDDFFKAKPHLRSAVNNCDNF